MYELNTAVLSAVHEWSSVLMVKKSVVDYFPLPAYALTYVKNSFLTFSFKPI